MTSYPAKAEYYTEHTATKFLLFSILRLMYSLCNFMSLSIEELQTKSQEWRSKGQSYNAKILGKDKSCPAEIFIKSWTPTQLKFRAIKSLCTWWGLALLSILIPIAHFFLVPMFLLLGLVFPFITYGKSSVILGGLGTCPYCDKPFEIAQAPNRWPMNDICSDCSRHVKIEKIDSIA